jgi:hypothetical protein
MALLYRQPQRFSFADKMFLSGKFAKIARPDTVCERLHMR